MSRTHIQIDVKWCPPKENWICINTDGAVQQDVAGCGGVIRDQIGKWIAGFVKNMRFSKDYISELWGAYEVLKFARSKGFTMVELRMDSSVVVGSIKGEKVVL
ncbi:hypothetical protein TSUD_278210 [Trifolium subterraneum]|uniref:RNase H type-1 domain-containing protein n=1 Tax=Trifolium subterraneum TaxID=3900 RepID=A0A2Z6MZE1_TRISU|nr:hypothetical protein TSUD_278210 [Trifolium subterraneum]